MAKTSKAQLEAIKRYEETIDRINVRLPKGTKDLISETGQSVNSFIIDAVMEKLETVRAAQGQIID